MIIDLPQSHLTLLALACQEMCFRRTEQAQNTNNNAVAREYFSEAEHYHQMSEKLFAANRNGSQKVTIE